ncbi:MAG TPA: hypothetical protein VFJ85_10515 [Acidimicrobiales bacterium]|nr:hypothetical protein [Acidimicrobiales bacterium]
MEPLAVQYVTGLTFDDKGRVRLMPGSLGTMTADARHLTVEFDSRRLVIEWSGARSVDVGGDDEVRRLPAKAGFLTSTADMIFAPREQWSYLAITDADGQEIIVRVSGVPASELREWVLAHGRSVGPQD